MYVSELIKMLQEVHEKSFEDKQVFDQQGYPIEGFVTSNTGNVLLVPSKIKID